MVYNTGNYRLIHVIMIKLLLFAMVMLSCQTSTKKQERIVNAQMEIVRSYLNAGLPIQAHEELRKIISEQPDRPEFMSLMGLTQLALGNNLRAVTYLRACYKRSAEVPHGLNLSSALIAAGQLQEAWELLQKLLKDRRYPSKERLYHNMGLVLEKRKTYNRAISYYKKALEENPSYYLTLLKLSLLYEALKDYRQAISYMDRARSFCQKCFEPIQHLSRLYRFTNNKREAYSLAVKYYKKTDISDKARKKADWREHVVGYILWMW